MGLDTQYRVMYRLVVNNGLYIHVAILTLERLVLSLMDQSIYKPADRICSFISYAIGMGIKQR